MSTSATAAPHGQNAGLTKHANDNDKGTEKLPGIGKGGKRLKLTRE